MRYSESTAASAETFRLVLQKLTELRISFSPVHYAILYEYVAGINPPLKEAVNALLASGHPPSEGEMEHIFVNHIVPEFLLQYNHNQNAVTREIQDLLGRLSESTASTSRDAARFQEGLETYRSVLENGRGLDSESLLNVIKGTLKGTLSMKQSTNQLNERLQESQAEINRLQKELQTARVAALVDPLTELLNRRGLDLEIETCVTSSRNANQPCTILMIDIDHFKKINDTHGHLAGDKVIQAVAKAIKMNVRGEDLSARVGGEEFAVVLPRTDAHQGYIVAEHIRTHVEQIELMTTKTRQRLGSITISIGLDSFPASKEWKKTLDQADKALYKSKTEGRNRTTVYFGD